MLGIVSSCAIVTLSLRRAVLLTSTSKNVVRDLEIRVRGHSRSLKLVPFDRLGHFLLVFYSNFVPKTKRYSLFIVLDILDI